MILWSCLKDVKPPVVYDVKCGTALVPSRVIGLHLELIWGTLSYFAFLR